MRNSLTEIFPRPSVQEFRICDTLVDHFSANPPYIYSLEATLLSVHSSSCTKLLVELLCNLLAESAR